MPPPSPAAPALPRAGPVRLVAPRVASPFAPGREIAFARVAGTGFARRGLRDGDHVALSRGGGVRGRRATESPSLEPLSLEHGDLAAVQGADGRAALWRVRPEGEGWRLCSGEEGAPSVWTDAPPRVVGVVVAVLRKFPSEDADAPRRRAAS